MRFPDDKDKDKEKEEKENINGAECERKQGNDEGRHCNYSRYSHYGVTSITPIRCRSSTVQWFDLI